MRRIRPAAEAMLFLALLALTTLIRSSGFVQSVVDWDESLYALVARELVRGHLPYVTLWANKPPGLFAIIALGFKAFGTNIVALRLVADIAVAISSFLLYRMGSLFGGYGSGIGAAAAIFYIAVTVEGGGLATNAEILEAPLLCGAMLLVLQGSPERPQMSLARCAWLGLWLGLAIQIKETAVLEAAAIVAIALLVWRIDVSRLATVIAVAAVPTAVAFGIYALASQSRAFLDANILATIRFGSFIGAPPATVGATMVKEALLFAPLPLLCAAALAVLGWGRSMGAATRALVACVALWLAAEALALAGLREFEGHQFVMLAAPMVLLSAYALWYVLSFVPHPKTWLWVVIALTYAAHAIGPVTHAARVTHERALTGDPAAGDDAAELAERVSGASRGDRSLFVMHAQPIVYFLTDSEAPTRYAYPPYFEYPVQERIAGIDGAAVVRRVRAAQPHFILTTTYVYDVDPRTLQAELRGLYPRYRLVFSMNGAVLLQRK